MRVWLKYKKKFEGGLSTLADLCFKSELAIRSLIREVEEPMITTQTIHEYIKIKSYSSSIIAQIASLVKDEDVFEEIKESLKDMQTQIYSSFDTLARAPTKGYLPSHVLPLIGTVETLLEVVYNVFKDIERGVDFDEAIRRRMITVVGKPEQLFRKPAIIPVKPARKKSVEGEESLE